MCVCRIGLEWPECRSAQSANAWRIHRDENSHWNAKRQNSYLKFNQRLSFFKWEKSNAPSNIVRHFTVHTWTVRQPNGLYCCWRPFSDFPFQLRAQQPSQLRPLFDSVQPTGKKTPIRVCYFNVCCAQAVFEVQFSFSTTACTGISVYECRNILHVWISHHEMNAIFARKCRRENAIHCVQWKIISIHLN